ncbi:alcohol dehydrogenase catalytic domain-containing protein [Paraburkholderia gardini]|uniref:alcohol dehydrogenase catalytic domain-containing protein n=1 Tax=Paraburkholderia gardini TaxID=2823469 RepID=UPI001D4369C0|nr:alcohol dehydrogenase catalytic domain-containing protein [Paraburkholderia gardini]CAG4909480.1 hypothetical protein R69919_03695 [Paraburkholderia gardini]
MLRAAGVNPVDLKTRAGHYPLIRENDLPYTLGRDCCGVVEQAGESVKWAPGDEVFAFVGQGPGAYAEYVKLDATALARRPASIDATVAGAVPLAVLTAWQGLFDHGCLERGERVLIHAGAGGAGHFAVQFVKEKGAEVFVTAIGDGVEFVRSLGTARFLLLAHTQDVSLPDSLPRNQDSWRRDGCGHGNSSRRHCAAALQCARVPHQPGLPLCPPPRNRRRASHRSITSCTRLAPLRRPPCTWAGCSRRWR